jgi:putative ABC transport system permease protein
MLKNYLNTAIRNIRKNKIYSVINIISLSLGMAFCILSFAYIQSELSFSGFFKNPEKIYRINTERLFSKKEKNYHSPDSPPQLASVIMQEFPEVETATMIKNQHGIIYYEDKIFYEKNGYYAGTNFFDVFSLPFLEGDPHTALKESNSIILTKETSQKYFGSVDATGRTLKVDSIDYKVTAVIGNIPDNSDIKFDYLMSTKEPGRDECYDYNSWWSGGVNTFIRLKNSTAESVENKFPTLIQKYAGNEAVKEIKLHLQPLMDIHLYSGYLYNGIFESNLKFIYILSAASFFVLLIGCINFINISIGLSSTRAKEIGIRKTIGASRLQIIKQFGGEIIIQCFISLCAGISLAELILPLFNKLVNTDFAIHFNLFTILYLLILGLFSGLISCGFTSLYLSGLRSADIFRNNIKIGGFNAFSKSLIILQFTLSVFFIIVTIFMYQQVEYMKENDKSYKNGKYIVMPLRTGQNYKENRNILYNLKNELKGYNEIISLSGASGYYNGEYICTGSGFKEDDLLVIFNIDYEYFNTLGLDLKMGRNFSPDYPSDNNNSIVINETLADLLKYDNPIGREYHKRTIIGVVKDFHFESLHNKIHPAMFTTNFSIHEVFAKVRPEKTKEALEILKAKLLKIAPSVPFEYTFSDDDFRKDYSAEIRIQKAFEYSSIMVILISCFGIFGLTVLAISKQRKEISIRKVFGASTVSIWSLLSKKYMILISIANIAGWVGAYFFIIWWLQNFAYRINISWLVFIFSGLMVSAMAMLTISWQILHAANVNPVRYLKYE